jgi:hypothetical protein
MTFRIPTWAFDGGASTQRAERDPDDLTAPKGAPIFSEKGDVDKSEVAGLRYNNGKVMYELIPPEALEALAIHYTQAGGPPGGPAKYPIRNWEKGMAWVVCFAALMRHSWKWMRGEDYDQETGTHHMICAAWNCFAIFSYYTWQIGEDDRPRRNAKS